MHGIVGNSRQIEQREGFPADRDIGCGDRAAHNHRRSVHNSAVDDKDGEKSKQCEGEGIHREPFALDQHPGEQSHSPEDVELPAEKAPLAPDEMNAK